MSDKILVLVTGGNQGLGYYAIQQLSATNKYHILMGSRDLAKADKAIKELTDDKSANANPSNVEAIQIEMSSDESIYAAAKQVEEKYGRLDILMPNAGIVSSHIFSSINQHGPANMNIHRHTPTAPSANNTPKSSTQISSAPPSPSRLSSPSSRNPPCLVANASPSPPPVWHPSNTPRIALGITLRLTIQSTGRRRRL